MNSLTQGKVGPGQRKRLHYAWIVVGVTFATMLVGAGVRYSAGVLIRPLEDEFGWDRASISLAIAIGLLIFGLTGPVAGALLDRFGPRRVMTMGLALTVVSLGSLTFMKELWQLHVVWGFLTGLGTGAMAGSLGAVVAARWFKTQRGMVMGVFSAATSMGQLVFIPVLMALTVAFGWRSAVGFLAVAGIGMILPVALLMRNFPSDKGLRAFGDAGTATTPAQRLEDMRQTPMHAVVRSRDFWFLAGNLFICGYTTTGMVGTHLIPYSLEHGFDEATTAGTMALMGTMNMVGTLLSGWLTDRYDNRRLLATVYGLRALSLFALPFILEAPHLLLFAVVYGLDWIASAPPTANLATNIYGKGSLGVVYGWIFFAHMIGASLAAFAGGLLRDMVGNYNIVFFSAALLLILNVAFSLGIRQPRQVRETVRV